MSHELDSYMLFIHPPLAIAGYFFIFLFTLIFFLKRSTEARVVNTIGLTAWLLTFLGLLTGMLWAQLSWGAYWTWDPKETMTLILFLALSANLVALYEKKIRLVRWLAVATCILVIATASTSYIMAGLHSFLNPV